MARKEIVLVAALAGAIAGTGASAQGRPDFSGHWIALQETAAAGGGTSQGAANPGSGLGSDITITQNSSSITIERAQFSQYDIQPAMKFAFALDGSAGRNVVNMGRGPQETVAKASWQDATLVITTAYSFVNPPDGKAMTSEVRQELTLEGPGTLVVVATRSAAPGGQSTTSRQTYKKK